MITVLALSLIIIRILVSLQPHSGEGNDHSNKAAYGGDYEAQRHWMELTYHLPLKDWYHYDLEYWGLDYPPLTAYVSYICGYFSHHLVGAESMELDESRGYEDEVHKAYMRGTVLFFDVLVYFSAVLVLSRRLYGHNENERLTSFAIALAQPAIVLVDHGHFQYNTICLGLSLWSFHFMTKSSFRDCVIGAFLFCMALNFKQMVLYYAPAVFAYLLSRCFDGSVVKRFCCLGFTVIASFSFLWWPFFVFPHSGKTSQENVLHVLKRQFPFNRGLFEGKVSNIWCTLSTKPISIRERIPDTIQPILALILTLMMLLPACIKLFLATRNAHKLRIQNPYKKKMHSLHHDEDLRMLLWSSTSTGLAFFLASFQVHEKSILLALSPISILYVVDPKFVAWFSIVSAWTLWPLIQVDKLQTAYFVCIAVFTILHREFKMSNETYGKSDLNSNLLCYFRKIIIDYGGPVSYLVMIGMHFVEKVTEAPENLPDLYAVIWSIIGCGLFCIALIYCTSKLYIGD